ncbi:MAG: DUF3303 family protein [Phycisphaerales bacterium]|nr:DUF3303 family protein [Phycisphaerales bacterium]MBL0927990.1 DUF3303 family protein [Phycisphaerales bacterium]
MLFMVIEHFRSGRPDEVGARFKARGRLMPEGAPIGYVASWMFADGSGCYQIMEAPSAAALEPWMNNWRDLVNFTVTPVQTSAEFWAGR